MARAKPKPASCSLSVQVGPSIVTHVQAHGGADLRTAPIPDLCNLQVASLLTGLSQGFIRYLLSTRKQHFDPPIEMPTILPNGRQTSRFPRRILTARDILTIRSWYPIRYRVKPDSPR